MISLLVLSVFCSLLTAVSVSYGIHKLHFRKLKQEMYKQNSKLANATEAEAMNRWSGYKTNRKYKILKSCFTPTSLPLPPIDTSNIITNSQERNRKVHKL